MKQVNVKLVGGFGNNILQWCFARAYAEKHGHQLHVPRWWGQKIFQLDDPLIEKELPERNEHQMNGDGDITFAGYAQMQKCMIYTRRDVKRWLQWRPEIKSALEEWYGSHPELAIHLRRGDLQGYGYVICSAISYARKAVELDHRLWTTVCEEQAHICPSLPKQLSFLADFWILTRAKTLLRANSTFSFVAHLLADDAQVVYSPNIDGLEGGKEHDVEFVLGNHKKFANLSFVEDLHIAP